MASRNLNETRAEVLQAFLNTLSTDGTVSSKPDEGHYTTEQVQKLSNKLEEIMGDASIPDDQNQDGDGQMVNEEGLPIVDISEPVSEDTSLTPAPRVTNTERLQSSVTVTEEPYLVPLSSLPAVEHERLRAQRDRILDILEEEEREHEAKQAARQEQERKDALERRKKEASDELDKLKAQRELQKKMGKALLKNMADARDREEKMRRQQEADDAQAQRSKEKANALKPRKSVSFAALPKGTTGDHGMPIDSASKEKTSTAPIMKIDVVERFPGKNSSGPGTPVPKSAFDRIPDSDDESELGSPMAAETSRNQDHSAEKSSDESGSRYVPDSSSDDDGGIESDGDSEEFDPDFDRIQHQREIALAYYEKRNAIGVEAHRAMTSHKHEADEGPLSEHPWDQPEVPLDATLAGPPPKPTVSRFKADRHPEVAAWPSTFASTSLGTSVLPESEGSVLQSAIRRGKLVDDDLVTYDSEDEDDDPAVRELLNALVRGEVQNTGPRPQGRQVKADDKSSAKPIQKASRPKATQDHPAPRTARPPDNAPVTAAYTTEPDHPTSTSVFERRAPQVRSPPSATPRQEGSFSPKTIPAPPTITPCPTRTPVNGPSSGFTSMVLESPSFRPPAHSSSSPSRSLRQADTAPTTGKMPGNVVISPSYPPTNRPQRPPTVMSAAVLERTVNATKAGADEGPKREKKVSRFRMERV